MTSAQRQECDQPPEYATGLNAHQVRALMRRGKTGKRARILELQRLLYVKAIQHKDEPLKLAACTSRYDQLEDRLRVIDGELKPGSINARDDSAAKGRSKRSQPKSSPPAGPVVYPAPSAESAPSVVSDNGEKPGEDGPKE